MIAKAKSCPGGTALFNYVIDERKGYEITRNNLSGISPREMFLAMQVLQSQNRRCKNNMFSVVISPTIEDGEKMTKDDFINLVEDFITKMNWDSKKAQYVAFLHTEKRHRHIHILVNRIDEQGKAMPDNYIGFEAQRAAHEAALKHGWTSIRQKNEEKRKSQKEEKKIMRALIRSIHYSVLKQMPKDLQAYMDLMHKNGIEVKPYINKQGDIQGYRFVHLRSGTDLKASEVDRNLKLNELFVSETSSLMPKAREYTQSSSQGTSGSFSGWQANMPLMNVLINPFSVGGGGDDDNNRKRKRKR